MGSSRRPVAPAGDSEIRWDTARLRELAIGLDRRAALLRSARLEAIEAGRRHGTELEMRATVLAAEWLSVATLGLRHRAGMLDAAERALVAGLGETADTWRPPRRARSSMVIMTELDRAFAAATSAAEGPRSPANALAELNVARLTLELATARHAALAMAVPPPHAATLATLELLIDYLAFELSRATPRPAPDWKIVMAAAASIRGHLDESWLSDITRADLVAIAHILSNLGSAEIDFVFAELSDAELYRWLRDLDGIAGGNLTVDQEAELFAAVAATASAPTLYRLASAERSGKFAAIAAAVQAAAPAATAIEFVEICAAHAATSEAALLAALSGLAALDEKERVVAFTSLHRLGLVGALRTATATFLAAQSVVRDDPIVVEFFEGVISALGETATTLAKLSLGWFYDSHEFRESWSRLGGVLAMLPRDPVGFVAVLLDLATLEQNPARWGGQVFTDVALFGMGRVARLGRLGALAKRIADWLERVGSRVMVRAGRVEIESGHVMTALERLDAAADAAMTQRAIEDIGLVESYVDQLRGASAALPAMAPAAAVASMRVMAQAAAHLISRLIDGLDLRLDAAA